MSRVDAFVVVHDHASTLAATLAGLAEQSLRPARVAVVCNECSDGSQEVARAAASRLSLELIVNRDNAGFSAAANQALRRLDADWVLAVNPDCRLRPDYLERLAGAAGRDARTGAATGLLMRAVGGELEEGSVVDSAGMVVTPAGRHLDRGAGGPLHPRLLEPAWVFGASGAAALYRRRALADVSYPGGEVFDERFFAYREDADLAWRLQRRGWGCLYWPAARAAHERGLKPEARRSGTPEINRHSVRNRFLLRWSNADWRWRVALLPCWLARDVAVVAACLAVERASLPGLAEAWRLRRSQRARGAANAARATAPGWDVVRWFLPGGHTRSLDGR